MVSPTVWLIRQSPRAGQRWCWSSSAACWYTWTCRSPDARQRSQRPAPTTERERPPASMLVMPGAVAGVRAGQPNAGRPDRSVRSADHRDDPESLSQSRGDARWRPRLVLALGTARREDGLVLRPVPALLRVAIRRQWCELVLDARSTASAAARSLQWSPPMFPREHRPRRTPSSLSLQAGHFRVRRGHQ